MPAFPKSGSSDLTEIVKMTVRFRPEADDIAKEIIENFEAGLDNLREVLAGLDKAC